MMVSRNSSQCEPNISRANIGHRVLKLNYKPVISAKTNGDQKLEIWTLLTTLLVQVRSMQISEREREISKS